MNESRIKVFLYLVAICVAIIAGTLDVKTQRHVAAMQQRLRGALVLMLFSNMELAEAQRLDLDAAHYVQMGKRFKAIAEYYEYRSEREKMVADFEYSTALKDKDIAAKDEQAALNLTKTLIQDENLYESVAANITLEQEKVDELKEELQDKEVNSGLCSTRLINRVCEIVGGVPALQHELDDEVTKIHQEWHEAEEINASIFLENLTISMLHGNATKYNQTSQSLLQAAQRFYNASHQDAESANTFNSTAEKYFNITDEEKQRASFDEETSRQAGRLADSLLEGAEREHEIAKRASRLAFFLSLICLTFFGYHAARRTFELLDRIFDWAQGQSLSDKNFFGTICYYYQHMGIFLVALGLVGDYLVHILRYPAAERVSIVTWFAFCAAALQLFALHAIPLVLADWPLTAIELYQIVGHIGSRLFIFMYVFAVELLIWWLLMGNGMFSQSTVAFMSNGLARLLLFVALALHIFYFGYPSCSADAAGTRGCVSEVESRTSETTPFQAESVSSPVSEISKTPTDELPSLFFAQQNAYGSVDARHESTHGNLLRNETSNFLSALRNPKHISTAKLLVLLLETLIITAMIKVAFTVMGLAATPTTTRLSKFFVFLAMMGAGCIAAWPRSLSNQRRGPYSRATDDYDHSIELCTT